MHELYIVLLVDHLRYHSGATHIRFHAPAYNFRVQCDVFFSNVDPGPKFRWLQLERCGGLTGVCIAAVSQPRAQWMKHPSVGLMQTNSHLSMELLELWFAVVEMVTKIITKSVMSWVTHCKLQFTSDWMTVNLKVLLKLHPAECCCNLEVSPMVLRFAVSQSKDVCVFGCRNTLKSTYRRHQLNEGKIGLVTERVAAWGALRSIRSKMKLAAKKIPKTHCLSNEEK